MKWIGYGAGGSFLLVGLVWFLQGIGLLPGSFMTGQTQWAFAGAGVGMIGVGLILWIRKRQSPLH